MKFKTTIKIITEAENKNEANDIVGEYLSGNITSGVDMKCRITSVVAERKAMVAAVGLVSFLLIAGAILLNQAKPGQVVFSPTSGVGAIQPPLKTSVSDNKSAEFKEEWTKRQDKEALEYIKK
jgi:hypothetical protein